MRAEEEAGQLLALALELVASKHQHKVGKLLTITYRPSCVKSANSNPHTLTITKHGDRDLIVLCAVWVDDGQPRGMINVSRRRMVGSAAPCGINAACQCVAMIELATITIVVTILLSAAAVLLLSEP